jgi:quinol monooxygenase YgiN
MEEDMIAIGGTIRFPPERAQEVRDILEPFVRASRQEPGNIHYYAGFDPIEPGMITIFEAYVGEAALEAHRASSHMAAWRAAGANLGVGDRKLYLYDIRGRQQL